MSADRFAFRAPVTVNVAGASPLLGAILLAIALCQRAEQLAQWWDWPQHREARWHLDPDELAQANAARSARLAQIEASNRAA